MQISYKPLWHTLLEKGMSKENLRTMAKLSTNAIANMGKDKNVSMSTLLKICETLQCDLDAVVELKGLDSVKETESEETVTRFDHKTYSPRLVSLFSGCGGMDKGFEDAGYSRVWANDFDKDAQAVFRLNLGEIDGRDITTVPVDDIPDCDILTKNDFLWLFEDDLSNCRLIPDADSITGQEVRVQFDFDATKMPEVNVISAPEDAQVSGEP